MLQFWELWLPLIGGGVFIAWAISAWYAGQHVLCVRLAFIGVAFLLLLAEQQVEHSVADPPDGIDISRMQARAFVGVYPQNAPDISVGVDPNFQFVIKNSGKTVAHNVAVGVQVGICDYPIKPKMLAEEVPVDSASVPLVPDGQIVVTHDAGHRLKADEVADIRDGTKSRFFMKGRVTYRDAFGAGHTTKFLYVYGGADMRIGMLTPYKEGNEAD